MVDMYNEEPLELPIEGASDPAPCISFHALIGQMAPSTLNLVRSINGHQVVILIDGGSINNFI